MNIAVNSLLFTTQYSPEDPSFFVSSFEEAEDSCSSFSGGRLWWPMSHAQFALLVSLEHEILDNTLDFGFQQGASTCKATGLVLEYEIATDNTVKTWKLRYRGPGGFLIDKELYDVLPLAQGFPDTTNLTHTCICMHNTQLVNVPCEGYSVVIDPINQGKI